MKTRSNNTKINQLICILRFGRRCPDNIEYAWLTYSAIGKLVKRSPAHVRRICLEFARAWKDQQDSYHLKTRQQLKQEQKKTWRRSNLDPQHLKFLQSESTLRSWSGHSLEDRRRFFHRQFPDKKLSKYYMRLAYREAGIKRRLISKGKKLHPEQESRILQEAKDAKIAVQKAQDDGYRLVYCDEFCTTLQTMPKFEWQMKNTSLKVDPREYHRKTIASVAAISSEKGAELILSFDKSINREKFISFLRKLRQCNPFVKLALFMDRLAVHRSNDVKEAADKYKILLIFNSSYSPDFNPIESAIGLAKLKIKRVRWNSLQNGEEIDLNEVIEKAFMEIERKKLQNYIRKS